YPVLQRVLVAFGEQIGFAPTLDEALDQVFGGDSGAEAGDSDAAGEAGSGEAGGPSEGDDEQPAGVEEALERARTAMQEADEALGEGDFGAYGEAQERLRAALEDAIDAEGGDAAAEDATSDGAPTDSAPAEDAPAADDAGAAGES
ncbi:MAG: UPF0182 family protein, partial [Brevibacterium yomogidense]